MLLRAARFTTGYVRLVGQEPAPGKCVLVSTFGLVGNDMRDWTLTDEGDRWTVKLDVRDFGGFSSLVGYFTSDPYLVALRPPFWL